MKCLPFGLTALIASGFFWAAAPAPKAHALCVNPQEEGEWVNRDANTRSITRANIRFQCQDQILNGQPYPPGDPFYISLFGACSPTDCAWEEVGARRNSPEEGNWLRATVDHGFARRSVWVKAYGEDSLRVWIWTNFTDPSREDYASNDWFVRR